MTEALRTPADPADETVTANAAAPARDLFSKFDALIAERQALLDSGVRDPFGLVMEKVLSPTLAVINGKETILLGTYNYMGMTFDPDVIEAGQAGARPISARAPPAAASSTAPTKATRNARRR